MCKKQKYDCQCYNCRERYSLNNLKEFGYIDYQDENYITWTCPKCGNETFIYQGKSYKSHLVDI